MNAIAQQLTKQDIKDLANFKNSDLDSIKGAIKQLIKEHKIG